MKKNVKNYLVFAFLFLCIVSLCWYGCEQNKKQERLKEDARLYKESHPFEKYVYLDTAGVLHRERKCFYLIGNAVQYYDTTDGLGYRPKGYCNTCFSSKQYEMFQKIEERARKRK